LQFPLGKILHYTENQVKFQDGNHQCPSFGRIVWFLIFTFLKENKYQMYQIPQKKKKKKVLLQMLSVISMIAWKWYCITYFDSSDFVFVTHLYCSYWFTLLCVVQKTLVRWRNWKLCWLPKVNKQSIQPFAATCTPSTLLLLK